MNNKVLGGQGEQAAADYLQQHGYRICVRNFRVPVGEIDIIASRQDTLVFVEVRQRASSRFGGAAASIGATKRAKLVTVAQVYLQTLKVVPPCRFDAVCIDGGRLEWLKNCIDASR